MSDLILPRRFKSQPQTSPQIDKRGVGEKARFALIGTNPRDLVSGTTRTGTAGTSITTASGIAFAPGTTAATWVERISDLDHYLQPFTVNWYGYLRTNVQGILLDSLGSSYGWYFYLSANSASTIRIQFYDLFTASAGSAIANCTDNTLHSLAGTYDGAGTVEYFLDGISIGTAAWTTGTGLIGANQTFGMYDDSAGAAPQRMLAVQAYKGKLAKGETARLAEYPWSVYKSPARRFLGATGIASPDVTLALTGQTLTSATGSLAPSTSKALTGQALATAQGTLTPSLSKELTGQALASTTGALSPSTDKALTGQSLSTAQGTLTPSVGGNVTVAITGQALATAQGTLSPSVAGQAVTAALSGQALTSAQGTLTPAISGVAVTVQLTGQNMTVGQGSFSFEQYAWDTRQGKAQPGTGTFRPLPSHKPEIVEVDIPDEESTCESYPIRDVNPVHLGPKVGLSGAKLPRMAPRNITKTPQVHVPTRNYKTLMQKAGTVEKQIQLSDFAADKQRTLADYPVENKRYLTKPRGEPRLKGN